MIRSGKGRPRHANKWEHFPPFYVLAYMEQKIFPKHDYLGYLEEFLDILKIYIFFCCVQSQARKLLQVDISSLF